MIRIKKGLDLPIKGKPEQVIKESKCSRFVAVAGADYPGMRPVLAVSESDAVLKGRLLFKNKNAPEMWITFPGTGRIKAIVRGERRRLLAVVIELSGTDEIVFKSYSEAELAGLTTAAIRDQLLKSGLWAALRAGPFNKIAHPGSLLIPFSLRPWTAIRWRRPSTGFSPRTGF